MVSINPQAFVAAAVANNNTQNLGIGIYPLSKPTSYEEYVNGLQNPGRPLLSPDPSLNSLEKIKAYAATYGPVVVNNSDSKYIVMPTGDCLLLTNNMTPQ